MAVATFETQHFAEGRFRYAYKGVYTAPPLRRGKKCVMKRMKDNSPINWRETLGILNMSKQLADGFNKYSNTNMPVKFMDVEKVNICATGGLQECVIVEDFIPGDYMKWCNNYGFIDPRDVLMQAFVHWSWAHTKGERMIADLQGVRNNPTYMYGSSVPTNGSYVLTDPCLLSNTYGGIYGYESTDTGVEGMAMFFLNHTCNLHCNNIPRPNLAAVAQQLLATTSGTRQAIGTSTANSREITFTNEIRSHLITLFKQMFAST